MLTKLRLLYWLCLCKVCGDFGKISSVGCWGEAQLQRVEGITGAAWGVGMALGEAT
jgi:hypothetical protein